MSDEYKVNNSVASGKLDQLNYNNVGKARKQIPVLAMPFKVIADASASAKLVGKGNLCRILGTALGYVAFGASGMLVPAIGSLDAIQTTAAWFLVVATDDYIFTSAAMRIEVISD